MDREDIIWITGFYEGEGSVFCTQFKQYNRKGAFANRKNYRLKVSITQKNPQVLYWIQSKLGFGSVNKSGVDCYRWSCASNNAREFLLLVIPFMKSAEKLTQAIKAQYKDSQNVRVSSISNI